jgi:hypothetical protein
MHATMAARGIGMPCGVVARFQQTGRDRVEDAIEKAKQRFPLMNRRVGWVNRRPVLVTADGSDRTKDSAIRSLFDLGCSFWRYRILQYGPDCWLTAIWPHAMADGPSMLRFLETMGATLANQPLFDFRYRSHRQAHRQAMVGWMMRFLIDQQLRYLRPSQCSFLPGVAWLTLPRDQSMRLIERSQIERASVAAWLAAAACMAFAEQERVAKGRVLLNVQLQRGSLEHIGGFGFGAGSLLMPVKINVGFVLPTLARRIFDRLNLMIDRGWNDNFERFLGQSPRRHNWLAALHAWSQPAPIVSVSWKGGDWQLGDQDRIRDVACFAVSPTAHISAHIDRAGMSLSITSRQSAGARQDLLRRLVGRLGGNNAECILTFDGYDVGSALTRDSRGASFNAHSSPHPTSIADASNRA